MFRVAYAYEQEAGWFKKHPILEETLGGVTEMKIIEKQNEQRESAGNTRADIQELGRLVDLSIPDVDSVEIGLRFDSLMASMKEIEELLGNQWIMSNQYHRFTHMKSFSVGV